LINCVLLVVASVKASRAPGASRVAKNILVQTWKIWSILLFHYIIDTLVYSQAELPVQVWQFAVVEAVALFSMLAYTDKVCLMLRRQTGVCYTEGDSDDDSSELEERNGVNGLQEKVVLSSGV